MGRVWIWKVSSMCIEEVSAEQFAEILHHYHEALAPDFNCSSESRPDSWQDTPANERSRLVAAIRLALLDISSGGTDGAHGKRRYFPKPGEAEWGC